MISAAEFYTKFQNMFGSADSRLKHKKIGEVWGNPYERIRMDPMLWEPVFCSNCGRGGCYVTKDSPIFYICQSCHGSLGTLPLPMVPGTEEI